MSYTAIYTHVRNKHNGIFPKKSIMKKGMGSISLVSVEDKSNKDSIIIRNKGQSIDSEPDEFGFIYFQIKELLKRNKLGLDSNTVKHNNLGEKNRSLQNNPKFPERNFPK